ncbi:hypothetical protein J437_LFUL019763 [Ladona fulva]|nr:hypothetical protein J437_LFUL019763 [Ladona fulva]
MAMNVRVTLLTSRLYSYSNRSISTSASCFGKRNFRKFLLYNKRGTRVYKQEQAAAAVTEEPMYTRGVRRIGEIVDGKFVIIPEMIPELIVPNLEDFELKPYVSYRTPDVYQSEFTAKDLFDACYSAKIIESVKAGKLDENSDPTSFPEESPTPEEAWREARKTGSDIF